MKNSHGFSWPETILSLSITFLISTTILPVVNSMIVQLEDKKRDYHSSLVMYEIAKLYTAENIPTGAMQVDGVIYHMILMTKKFVLTMKGCERSSVNVCQL